MGTVGINASASSGILRVNNPFLNKKEFIVAFQHVLHNILDRHLLYLTCYTMYKATPHPE